MSLYNQLINNKYAQKVNLLFPLLLIAAILIFTMCANPLAPNGGPRDKTAPKLDSLKSTANKQTHFSKQQINLTFDEWIKLEDAFNQVVVSPPLNTRLEILLRGKSLHLNFAKDEVLKTNVTYTINFGNAIRDLTEGNEVKNFRFIFSTGDYIDSLKIKGKITKAQSKEAAENVVVMLYDNFADTVVRKTKPFYFAKTDKTGNFIIENMKAGDYKAFALEDSNLNYLFDSDKEKIGFLEGKVTISDKNTHQLNMQIFENKPKLKLLDKDFSKYGLVKLTFNTSPYDISVDYEKNVQNLEYKIDKDTLNVYYKQENIQNWKLFINKPNANTDTILVKTPDKATFLAKAKLKSSLGKASKIFQNPNKTFDIKFNNILKNINIKEISLEEDTLKKETKFVATIDTLSKNNLKIATNWKDGKTYQLMVRPNAIEDMYGLKNIDTLHYSLLVAAQKNYGDIILNISNLATQYPYILQITSGQSDDVVEEILIKKGKKESKYTFRAIPPGEYAARIIEDINGNGRWDTGDYDTKKQPEPIMIKKLDILRANWDLEVNLLFEP